MKALLPKDEDGHFYLNEQYLQDLCEEHSQFHTPSLNTTLYLHFKGFEKIQALDKYVNLRCLFLEGNGIEKISGLDNLVQLKSLYLQSNSIKKIEGLDKLTDLVTLSLAQNQISCIENLGANTKLTSLDISKNKLTSMAQIEGLRELPNLETLDLQTNYIEFQDDIVDQLGELKTLRCLYFKGNPAMRKMTKYRKSLTVALPVLCFIDDRPVYEVDRVAVEAFKKGGLEEERKARDEYLANMNGWIKQSTEHFEQEREKGKERMKKQHKLIKDRHQEAKTDLVTQRNKLKAMIAQAKDRKSEDIKAKAQKVQKIEADLKLEIYQFGLEEAAVLEMKDTRTEEEKEIEEQAQKDEFMLLEAKRLEGVEEREKGDIPHQQQPNDMNAALQLQLDEINSMEAEMRENPQKRASAVAPVPKVVPKVRQVGAVVTTESESEIEQLENKIKPEEREMMKWTPFYEEALEESLLKSMFDFEGAARELSHMVNDPAEIEEGRAKFVDITAKTLQLKWTDIEIRQHRLRSTAAPIHPTGLSKSTPVPEPSVPEKEDSSDSDLPPEPVEADGDIEEETEEFTNLEELD